MQVILLLRTDYGIYKLVPSQYRTTVPSFLPVTSRFTLQKKAGSGGPQRCTSRPTLGGRNVRRCTAAKPARATPLDSPALFRGSHRSTSLTGGEPFLWLLVGVVPPPPDYEPFELLPMHALYLVTRTRSRTLASNATPVALAQNSSRDHQQVRVVQKHPPHHAPLGPPPQRYRSLALPKAYNCASALRGAIVRRTRRG
jgi:hypothetical protein